ncbi:MAG: hypothetical protein NC237_13280 [Eubacterium sp.]|nr:hypothetical protein [Eubacterium sp.]
MEIQHKQATRIVIRDGYDVEVARLRALATKVAPSTERGSSGGNVSDRVGRTVARIVDLENEINHEIDRLVDLRKEIEAAIEGVRDERERVILTERYVNGKKWSEIAERLNVEIRWVFRIHKRALSKIKIDH